MKFSTNSVLAALAMMTLLVVAPGSVSAAEAPGSLATPEATVGVRGVVDGSEFYCNNCYDISYCDSGLLITWQDFGPEDAFVLAIQSAPDCYETDDTCDDLIKCNTDSEWDAEDSKLAAVLEEALDMSDYATAAGIIRSNPNIGTFVAERGVVIVRASECVGGVRAVLSVEESFADAL